MHKLIAIRKQSRLDDARLEEAPVEEKRAELVQRAQVSDQASELSRAGFKSVDPPTVTNDQYIPLPEAEPSFSRLGYLGAYIINTPSFEWEEKAREFLEGDYDVFENLTLMMPSPTITSEWNKSIRFRIAGSKRCFSACSMNTRFCQLWRLAMRVCKAQALFERQRTIDLPSR